jgi:ATP-dependent Clp protease protease subunit
MMDAETWMSAHKAIELKFADKILYESESVDEKSGGFIFDQMTVTNALRNKLPGIQARMKYLKANADVDKSTDTDKHLEPEPPVTVDEKALDLLENQIPIAQLQRRLELIKNWR